MASSEPNVWENIVKTIALPYLSTTIEIQRLFPDSVLFGSLILFITTMNSVFGFFAIFLLEVFASHKLLSTIISKFVGPVVSGSSSGPDGGCFPGFRGARKEASRELRFNEYPSISLTTLSAMATYILSSMIQFNDTLKTMGKEWNTRFAFSMIFIGIILLTVFISRWYAGCESVSEMMIALFVGLFLGLVFFFLNKSLFGLESINFLGLPYVVDKSDQGSDIYVCAPQI